MSQAAVRLKLRSRSWIVIPARLASTRLPGKLLLRDTGKSLLQHTYESAQNAHYPVGVCVAAADEDIAREVRRFGGQAVMTRPQAPSGTDRVAEAAARLESDEGAGRVDIIVNVQGDEPEISGLAIDLAIDILEQNPQADMSTLATPIRSRRQLNDPACVKVVFNKGGRAMYFSRSPIPAARNWSDDLLTAHPPRFFQHVGLYAYRRSFLAKLARTPPTPLEDLEKLEQLRVLETGHEIYVGVIDEPTVGIDTPEDYRAFVRRCAGR